MHLCTLTSLQFYVFACLAASHNQRLHWAFFCDGNVQGFYAFVLAAVPCATAVLGSSGNPVRGG